MNSETLYRRVEDNEPLRPKTDQQRWTHEGVTGPWEPLVRWRSETTPAERRARYLAGGLQDSSVEYRRLDNSYDCPFCAVRSSDEDLG